MRALENSYWLLVKGLSMASFKSSGNLKLALILFLPLTTLGQELNARVEIDYQQMKSTIQYESGFFIEIQNNIQNLMNNTNWTTDVFNQNEKIECSLLINLSQSPRQNEFSGTARFQVARPVYGTEYKTVTMQFVDQDFEFSYQPEEQQMVFNEQVFRSNITSLAAFYGLLALAVDYDSFSELGGSPYIQRLYNLVNLAGRGGSGWTQAGKTRNRFYLVQNLQDQQLNRFREGFYQYHRLVLDDFGREPEKGRREVLKLLEVIQNIATLKPNAVLINSFFDAKVEEMVNIFSDGSSEEKQRAFQLLTGLDPEKTEMYRNITKY